MKKVPKDLLDAAIDGIRGYYSGLVKLDNLTQREKRLAKATGTDRTSWAHLLDAVIPGYGGLKPDATNEDIYAILAILGYEVS